MEGAAPVQDGRVAAPGRDGSIGVDNGADPCQRLPLRLKINRGIAVRGLEARVSEPVADRHEVHAGLEEIDEVFTSSDIVRIYLGRWPNQECQRRDTQRRIGFGRIHGYGKVEVEHVAVVTRLEVVKAMLGRLNPRRGW